MTTATPLRPEGPASDRPEDRVTGTLGGAINAGLRAALDADPKVVLMGLDIGKLGGVFRITDGLQKDFGDHRVLDMPLAESGMVGTAFGLALRGYRPVVEIQFDGFVYPAFDQIISQVAKIRYRTAGRVGAPMVIRIPYGGGIGAVEHHSESPEAYFAHTAGLRVVAPSTPHDAYWMIQQAVASDDPVIFFEPKRRYWDKGAWSPSAPDLPLDRARIMRMGTDATVVTYGSTVGTAVLAAEVAEQEGRSLEVVDLRSLSPLDMDTVCRSVRRTGRLVVAHEDTGFLGMASEIAAQVSRECFYSLEAPVERVTGFHVPYPAARLERHHLPDVDRILAGVDTVLR